MMKSVALGALGACLCMSSAALAQTEVKPAAPVAAAATAAPAAAAAPAKADDAILRWALDDAKDKTAVDSSDKKNNGTIDGEAAWVEGKVKGALSFPEGKNSSVSVATVNGIQPGNSAHTVAAWVKVTKLPETRAWVLLLGAEGDGSNHWLINSAGETQFGVWGGNQVKPKLEVGVWKHVAITFDGTTLKGYLDGQKAEEIDAAFNLQGVSLSVAQAHNGENSFEGVVDDLRIYARALSDKEVAALAKIEAK